MCFSPASEQSLDLDIDAYAYHIFPRNDGTGDTVYGDGIYRGLDHEMIYHALLRDPNYEGDDVSCFRVYLQTGPIEHGGWWKMDVVKMMVVEGGSHKDC
ncbi:hypothetical protein Hanom_Chr09g00836951 [Helianthus anomalus]